MSIKKAAGANRGPSGQSSDWPSLISELMGRSFMDPKATWNLGMAQARDLNRALWGSPADGERGAQGSVRWLDSSDSGSASAPRRAARLFSPQGVPPGAPLIVMLHGCMQDAESFAKLTRMDELAVVERFHVLYPDQEGSANAMQCWNWNAPQNQSRLGGEPESLASLIGQAQALCGSAPSRTSVAGISAGAALGAAMAHLYPDLIGSAALVAGPAAFCASDLPEALEAMASGPRARAAIASDAKALQAGAQPGHAKRIPILIVQGGSDETVNPKNGLAQELSALALNDALDNGALDGSIRPRREQSKAASGEVRLWRDSKGDVIACSISPSALGHAWSGGAPSEPFSQPGFDQSRLALDFFRAAESGLWGAFDPKELARRLWGRRAEGGACKARASRGLGDGST